MPPGAVRRRTTVEGPERRGMRRIVKCRLARTVPRRGNFARAGSGMMQMGSSSNSIRGGRQAGQRESRSSTTAGERAKPATAQTAVR